MKLWQTVLAVTVTIGVTGGTVALMFSNQEETKIVQPDEPYWNVRTITSQANSHRPQIHLIGQVAPVNDITEVSQLTAQVTALFIRDGEYANKGDIIVQLDDFDAKLQVSQLQADLADLDTRIQMQKTQQKLDVNALDVEKTQLQLLQERLKQQTAIQQTGLAAQQSIDDLKQQIQRQKFTVLQRDAAIANGPNNLQQLSIAQTKLNLSLTAAKRHLSNTKIAAPFSGNIAKILVTKGQRITSGQPLFRIYSSDAMNIEVQLPTQLQQQRTLLNGTAFQQNRTSQITFSHSEAQLTPGLSGVKAWFNLEPSSQWLPGDIATIRLNLPPVANTHKIPTVSLFQDRWIYSIDAEQHLSAFEVKVLGSLNEPDGNYLIVAPITEIQASLRLLATRLNNPTTGMKIYEKGIDPEPPAPKEDADESDVEEDDGGHLNPDEASNEDA